MTLVWQTISKIAGSNKNIQKKLKCSNKNTQKESNTII